MSVGKRQSRVQTTSVIPTTSDIGHWSWESVSFIDRSLFPCSMKENGFPRRFAQRDGGIPRFIDLPPSPFRGNDRGILAGYAVFGSSTKYENGRMLSLLLWRHCVKGGGQIII